MSAAAFATAMAALAVVAVLLAAFVVVGRLRGEPFLDTRQSLWAAAAIAVVSTAGSLTFSEVYDFTPCLLCWWQRILMYPSALLLAVAAVRQDLAVRRYVLALTVPGMAFSAWHALVQRVPSLLGDSCEVGASCAGVWVRGLGFGTIPTMALVGFAAVTVILAAAPLHEGSPT
jgi:disulfide bond formation protein DsbB